MSLTARNFGWYQVDFTMLQTRTAGVDFNDLVVDVADFALLIIVCVDFFRFCAMFKEIVRKKWFEFVI